MENIKIFKIEDFNASGDGITDDAPAIQRALEAVKAYGAPAVLKFGKNKSYLARHGTGVPHIFEMQQFHNFSLVGENTTIVMDMTDGFGGYMNINECSNVKISGLNFKTAKPLAVPSDVTDCDIEQLYIDIITDISLEITGEYVPDYSVCFGLPLTDYNRAHMFIKSITVLDAGENRYRVYFKDMDNVQHKLKSMIRDRLRFLVPVPFWGQRDFGGVIVTNTENALFEDVNMWASTCFAFHMRYNNGVLRFENVKLTPEPNTNSVMASWRDGFHFKENRGRIVMNHCHLEKIYDDIFNFSVTMMRIDKVYNPHEFNLFCDEFSGTFWARMLAGDTLQIYDETNAAFCEKVKIKEVISQSGSDNHIVIDRDLPELTEGFSVAVLDQAQSGSEINDCYINGTWRFATPTTIRRCTFDTIFAWIQNIVNVEGPVPEHIKFEECSFRHIKAPDPMDSFIRDDYMLSIGVNTRNAVVPGFSVKDIVFENCHINTDEVELLAPATGVQFI